MNISFFPFSIGSFEIKYLTLIIHKLKIPHHNNCKIRCTLCVLHTKDNNHRKFLIGLEFKNKIKTSEIILFYLLFSLLFMLVLIIVY